MKPLSKIEKIFDIKEQQILTKIKVANPDKSKTIITTALWDTGSSLTSISDRVVEELSLKPTKSINSMNSTGISECMRYHGIIFLEELSWIYESINLIESNYHLGQNHDIIIGMNIIKLGDFNIKLIDDGTKFTFTFSFNGESTRFFDK